MLDKPLKPRGGTDYFGTRQITLTKEALIMVLNYWNYRVFREPIDGVGIYQIIEVYYDKNGIVAWSNNTANILVWSDLEDLKQTVEVLPGAFQKPVLIRGKDDELIEDN